MQRPRYSLVRIIQLIFFISLFAFSGLFLIIQIFSSNEKFNKQSEYLKTNYTEEQKALVKREVERVVGLIDSYLSPRDQVNMKAELLQLISSIRYGREGYIFVNTLDGYALLSNGDLMNGDKLLWEVFDKNPGETKELFRKEYDAALKPEGDFIYYSIRKLSDSVVESPKVSFIYGLPELNWLIGAGVYLDDVDKAIAALQEISFRELKEEVRNTILITLALTVLFLMVILLLGKRLKQDFQLFTDFFDRAVMQDAEIDLTKLRFTEMITMAIRANTMQLDKSRAREQLKVSENQFRLLAENSKDMIFQKSLPDGGFSYISPASLDILGYAPEEIMADPFSIRKMIHPDWAEWLEERFREFIEGTGEETVEYMLINKAGEEVWITQKTKTIRNENGGITAIIGRLSDETKRKNMEVQLSRRSRMDAIGQLAGGIAHDFNNVLAGIINAAQVLKSPKRDIDEKGLKMADLILQAAKRAADLTSKLSSFSRKKTLLLKPQDMHHIIEETEGLLIRTIDKKIILNIAKEARNSIVIGDGSELQSIILNLGINASQAIADGGSIFIGTENRTLDQIDCDKVPFDVVPGEYIQIEVRDSGQGISPDNLEKIFDPFFSTKEKGKGTGLGLATVYNATLQHRGLIEVQSEINKGTSFFLLLPCSSAIPKRKAKGENRGPQSGQILLVDDEEIIRSALKIMLEDAGYTVQTAGNGKEAVEFYRSKHREINAVVMDVVMPHLGGIDAFNEMKKINGRAKIILISGQVKNHEIKELKQAGLKGFLKKPFTVEELVEALSEVLI